MSNGRDNVSIIHGMSRRAAVLATGLGGAALLVAAVMIVSTGAGAAAALAGTLTPFLGSNCVYDGNFGTSKGEALRERVNRWIRTSHAFDGVVDFDRAIASPYDSRNLNASYNSTGGSACQTGDSLHPNDLGDEVMADAIPPRWFMR